jgi:hypothetical protein
MLQPSEPAGAQFHPNRERDEGTAYTDDFRYRGSTGDFTERIEIRRDGRNFELLNGHDLLTAWKDRHF